MLSETECSIRHCILLGERFTIPRVVDITGLKIEDVVAEIQQMEREGLVTSLDSGWYKLTTDDWEARLALSRSIEASYDHRVRKEQARAEYDVLLLLDFARQLALALADEVAYTGDEDAAEKSLELLARARIELHLEMEFDEIDSLVEERIRKCQ